MFRSVLALLIICIFVLHADVSAGVVGETTKQPAKSVAKFGGLSQSATNSPLKKSAIDEAVQSLSPNPDQFKVSGDEATDRVLRGVVEQRYPDDSIKVIKNASKNRHKHLADSERQVSQSDTHIYQLKSVVINEDGTDWFVIINNKIYSKRGPTAAGILSVVGIGPGHAIVDFLFPSVEDIRLAGRNKDKHKKYAERIDPSSDGKHIRVKFFVGQTYDSMYQRIYDGLDDE